MSAFCNLRAIRKRAGNLGDHWKRGISIGKSTAVAIVYTVTMHVPLSFSSVGSETFLTDH